MSKRRDVDPHKRDMRSRFKRLVRAVMINRQWLDEPDEQAQGISMNVKKNLAFLVRQKRKTGILTVAEKALLRSPAYARTVEERKKLCMIVAGLTCFSRIPPKLRARLVPVIKFMTVGADRILMKEHDFPLYIYFVISGEIEMKKTLYDKATKKTTMISEAIVGPGDWIGDVEVLENCSRLNTYVTISSCELLCITELEFRTILGPFMRKQWADKKTALKTLNYFDFFTEEQIVRACSYGLLIQYDPLQFIYSDNRGAVSYVHFILSGECTILQCLKMRVLRNVGKITYDLVKVNNADGFDLDAKTSKTRLRDSEVEVSNSDFNLDDLLASTDSQDAETLQEKKAKRKIGLREVEIACGYGGIQLKRKIHRNPRRTVLRRRTTYVARRLTSFGKTTSSTARASSMHGDDDEDYFAEDAEDEYDYIPEDYFVEEEISVEETPTTERTTMKSMISSNRSTARSTLKSLRQSDGNVLRVETDDSMNQNTPRDTYISPTVNVVPETETRFVDVGSLTYGGIFGLGETIVHRVIMARTVVQCMLLPRFWLMEPDQNPGHIWKRRKFYLEGCVPSREELFGNFLKTRRWEKFKHDYVQSTLNPNSVNSTQPEDIPIISRIVETRDDI
ncbi:uncharacterized protein LOC132796175 [Drosophila nasuta]|uniref:uncharacterized protein LOC132796175 n=1 Tax=Drosophila nasuta TaxID=42062 RepID=UPI00295E4340|nr:uncharacterized protein LOC132796175 [Drosophila nasuta]